MSGKFNYQRFNLRMLGMLPFLICIILMQDVFLNEMEVSDLVYYLSGIITIIVIWLIYFYFTRKSKMFFKSGSWKSDKNSITINLEKKKYKILYKDVEEIYVSPVSLYNHDIFFVKAKNCKVKIFSKKLKRGKDYDKDFIKMYDVISKNCKGLKPEKDIKNNTIEYWLKKSK